MKLEKDVIDYITTAVNTAKLATIENLVIEEGRIRGMDENQTIVILQDENVPTLPFSSLGLLQVTLFANRLDIFFNFLREAGELNEKDTKRYSIDVEVDEERNFVRSIVMKAGRLKIGTRCSNPAHVKAPRVIHDAIANKFQIKKSMVNALSCSTNAMGNVDEVKFHSTNDGIAFTVEDQNSEPYTYTFEDNENITQFSHKYPLKLLLSLLKQNIDGEFGLGEKGMFNTIVNGFNIYVLPKAN